MAASSDDCRRFVLPEGSALRANLAALWSAEPKLAAELEGICAPYPTIPTPDGVPTVHLPTPDGRSIALHSKHRPLDEARRLVESAGVDKNVVFCVHGFGLGHHVKELFEQASDEAILIIFEPDLRMVRTALEAIDLSAAIQSRRLLMLTTLDKPAMFTQLTPHTAMISVGLGTLTHPASVQLQPEFHRQMQVWFMEFVAFCRTNLNTLLINGKRTCENIANNLGWYVATPSLSRLKGRYAGKPAIIVSAGPSLRKNKHLLADAAGKSVIIAVQTTFQPLLDLGVEPHFVTSLDYHDICTRFFEKVPPTVRTELVAEPKATAAIFAMNPGPISLLGNDLAEKLVREMKVDKERLPSGATVAHLAYYLAEHLGCDPIIFVGQDLGFGDGLCYTPGTSYEDVWRPELSRFCTVEMKQWEQIIRDRPILRKIPDHQGRPMYTEERLFTYLQQFERDFASTKTRIIDATEGGARKRGTTVMRLADAIAAYCTRPVGGAPTDHGGYRWELLDECRQSLMNRRHEAEEMGQIARRTLPLLEEIRDHLDNQRRVNSAIARIDVLRARMNELGPCYDLILQMTQQTELNRFRKDRHIAAAKVTGVEKQRRQVQRDIENVLSIQTATTQFLGVIDNAIERLEMLVAGKIQGRAA